MFFREHVDLRRRLIVQWHDVEIFMFIQGDWAKFICRWMIGRPAGYRLVCYMFRPYWFWQIVRALPSFFEVASSKEFHREDRECTHDHCIFLSVCCEGPSAHSFGNVR